MKCTIIYVELINGHSEVCQIFRSGYTNDNINLLNYKLIIFFKIDVG